MSERQRIQRAREIYVEANRNTRFSRRAARASARERDTEKIHIRKERDTK